LIGLFLIFVLQFIWNFPISLDSLIAQFDDALEFIGTLLFYMPLASNPIVEILEVVKDLYLGFCPRWVNQLIHPLAL
jgi:hypothetical protein